MPKFTHFSPKELTCDKVRQQQYISTSNASITLNKQFFNLVFDRRDLAGELFGFTSGDASRNNGPGNIACTSECSFRGEEDVWHVLYELKVGHQSNKYLE